MEPRENPRWDKSEQRQLSPDQIAANISKTFVHDLWPNVSPQTSNCQPGLHNRLTWISEPRLCTQGFWFHWDEAVGLVSFWKASWDYEPGKLIASFRVRIILHTKAKTTMRQVRHLGCKMEGDAHCPHCGSTGHSWECLLPCMSQVLSLPHPSPALPPLQIGSLPGPIWRVNQAMSPFSLESTRRFQIKVSWGHKTSWGMGLEKE